MSTKKIDVDGDTLTVKDGKVVFRHPVEKAIESDGIIVVLLNVPTGSIDNRNVIGISEDGDRLWEIEPISNDPSADQAYVNLYEEDGDVWVFNPIGARCRIDIHSGDLIEKEVTR